jgi:hypothetical protein
MHRRVAPFGGAVRVYGDPIMRTTVGPLPPAVYWRRRAVVLGAVLLGIIVLFVSCTGNGKTNQGGKAASTSLPTPAPATTTESDPPFVDGVPGGGGPSLPDPGSIESQQAGNGVATTGSGQPTTGTGSNTNVTVPADGSCSDAEMAVTPIPATTTVKRAAPLELSIKIKNVGRRTCTRDVGSDPQELYLDQGARKYWSSDDCGATRGNDVRQFAPGDERLFKITWNGRESSTCASGLDAGPAPPPGQFDLRARLGTLISNPVALTIIA